jgi:cobalamin-dependent methionine synthase I
MKIDSKGIDFVIVGENIHTTRVVLRKGKLVVDDAQGTESVRFYDTEKKRRYLPIPEKTKTTQDYEEGRVKHVKIAVEAAMAGEELGYKYLARMVQRQVEASADFLDLNIDEIALKLDRQREAMQWLVSAVMEMTDTALSIDSSNAEIIEVGLEACAKSGRKNMLNSASLERRDALDLAKRYECAVVVSAAGESGMPQNADGRVDHATQMVDAALEKGIPAADIYVDPLVFPISVDMDFGNHCLDAIRSLRQRYGAEIHITGGFSNVSFGIPCRQLVNEVFLNLVEDAGADSGIVDPVASDLNEVFTMEKENPSYKLAEDMLLGRDQHCKTFLKAYRNGELAA